MSKISHLALAVMATSLIGANAHAAIWADNFNSVADGSGPSLDFAGGLAGDDYTTGGSTTNNAAATGGAMSYADSSTTGTSASKISSRHFATYSSLTDGVITFQADVWASSFATSTSPTRLFQVIENNAARISLDLVRTAASDGDAAEDVALVINGAAVGLNTTTHVWASGFDFGNYDTANAANNTTTPLNGSAGANNRYRVTFVLTPGAVTTSQAVNWGWTVTNTGSGDSVSGTFANVLNASGFNTTDTNDFIQWTTGLNATGSISIDDISVSTGIPEPTMLAITGVAGLLGLRRRSR